MSSEDARLHPPRIFLDSKSARAGGSAYTGAIGNAADYDERKIALEDSRDLRGVENFEHGAAAPKAVPKPP